MSIGPMLTPEKRESNKRLIASIAYREGYAQVSRQIMRETFPAPDPDLAPYLLFGGLRPETSVEDQIRLFCRDYKLEQRPDTDPARGSTFFTPLK